MIEDILTRCWRFICVAWKRWSCNLSQDDCPFKPATMSVLHFQSLLRLFLFLICHFIVLSLWHCQAEDETSPVFVPKNKSADDPSIRITKCVLLSILSPFIW